MTWILAVAAIYYLVGVVGSYKLTKRSGEELGTIVPKYLNAAISSVWPLMLFYTYAKAASH